MEIKISTQQFLKVLYVVAWIIFIGLCIEAGGIIFNTFFALFINPKNASTMWGMDLGDLYQNDSGRFLMLTCYMIITSLMKALMFYLIVKVLHDKKLNLVQPFNTAVARFIAHVAYLAIGIGIFSLWGIKYADWLLQQGIVLPETRHLGLAGADVWLFMGIVLLVIAQIFKRGIEIQDEHELTV